MHTPEPSLDLSPEKIPPSKMKYIYIARVVLKLFSGILEPGMLNMNIKKDKTASDEQRRLMVTQQAIRQGVTFFTDSFTFIGGGLLANHVLNKLPQAGPAIDRRFSKAPKLANFIKRTISKLPEPAILGVISGLVGEEIVGNLLFRPFLMTKVTAWWDRHQKTTKPQHSMPMGKPTLVRPQQGFAANNGYNYPTSSISPNYPTYRYDNRLILNRTVDSWR